MFDVVMSELYLFDGWILSLYTNKCVNKIRGNHVWGWCDWHWIGQADNIYEKWRDKEHKHKDENNREKRRISNKIK